MAALFPVPVVVVATFAPSGEVLGGLLLFTKRCWPGSYTIEESRLIVTGRLPALPERIVREIRAGCVAVANVVPTSAVRGGFLMTDHFSPAAEAGLATKALS